MISEELIHQTARGDIDAMVRLDRMGLSPALDEDADAFSKRLELLNQNLSKLDRELSEHAEYTVEDVTIRGRNRIPPELYHDACDRTDALYGFRCEWVPGFFINPSFSGLFGGCAYYFFPDFYALFIIRESFRKKKRWLVYDRDELLAHELCHVARVGLFSTAYEEFFAYQTSRSHFRRLIGGIFQSQTDVFLFMGATFAMLLLQILRTFLCRHLPVYTAWMPIIAIAIYLGWKLIRCLRRIRKAAGHLKEYFRGDDRKARIALFHCSDEEIRALASATAVTECIRALSAGTLRWKILCRRLEDTQEE